MKTCPKCQNKYTDDTLKFCLQDGSELLNEEIPVDSAPTVAFDETESETIVSKRRGEAISFDLSNSGEGEFDHKSQVTKVSNLPVDDTKGSKTIITVLLTAIVMLLLFGLIGIGAFFYINNNNQNLAKDTNNRNGNKDNGQIETENTATPKNPPPNKTKNPTPQKTKEPTPENTPDENPEQTKKDVKDTIYNWKSLAESKNLDQYMKYYASKLDYYRKRGASKSFVTKDKQNSFSKYDTIKSTITNMDIKPSKDGNTAVAEFDKEWLFTSTEGNNSGKVRSQLKLKKSGDNWLITSERDVKVYYVNK